MSTQNLALIYKKVPTEFPVVGEHITVEDVKIDLDQALPADSVLLQTLYVSFDPYLRGLMRDPSVKSYMPAFALDAPMRAGSLCKVLKSTLAGFAAGDVVSTHLPIQQYNVFTKTEQGRLDKVDVANGPADIRHYLSALGMPGLTAYSSLYEIGKPKKGETIFVSSAAGAVGQLVGQLAKREGLTVLGSVGSDDKVDFIQRECGFDAGWNYKKEKSTKDVLDRLTDSKGIDIFYDNVGGEQLEGSLDSMKWYGRVVECGQISQYNLLPEQRYPIRNTFQVVARRLSMIGFLVGDPTFGPKYYAEHQANMAKWIKDGSINATFHEWEGMENAGKAFVGMLRGENFGKAVLKVA